MQLKRTVVCIDLMTAGISEVVERNIRVFGQQGDVELEVCNLVEEIFRTGIICESLEQ